VARIESVLISPLMKPNRVVWHGTSSGVFTVRNAYLYMREGLRLREKVLEEWRLTHYGIRFGDYKSPLWLDNSVSLCVIMCCQ
jgi:hypothetical protein